MTQKRFKPFSRLQENLYIRQDGTLANFMTTEFIDDIFRGCNVSIEENKYVERSTTNTLTGAVISHLFVQARIRKLK